MFEKYFEKMADKVKYIIICLVLMLQLNVKAQSVDYPAASVLSTGTWYYVSVSSDGIYKLTYNDFISMGASETEIDFDNVSVFGNGGLAIDEINAGYKFSDLKENAIYVNKNEKYLLFYAQSTTKTTYDGKNNKFSFSLHPYATETRYFITFDKNIGTKKRIQTSSETEYEVKDVKTTALDYAFHKRELENNLQSGRYWIGEKFLSTTGDMQIPLALNNINTQTPANVFVQVVSQDTKNTSFDISLNNQSIGKAGIAKTQAAYQSGKLDTNITVANANASFNLRFNASSPTGRGWLDYILVNYTKNLTFNNNYLRFFSSDTSSQSALQYNVSNVLSPNTMVWDVTNPVQVCALPAQLNNQVLSFKVNADTIRTIAVVAGSSFPSPSLGDTVFNQNLHATDTADFIIISHELFLPQAERLAQIHRQYDGIKVAVVELQQVFNEFSSGTRDFLAMREFIRCIYNKTNGKYPENVLLFGDGTYDNKNILQYNNNFIPTYQSKTFINDNGENVTSDDVLAAIGDESVNSKYDTLYVGIGRIPAGDTLTANVIVDKCERYITKSDLIKKDNGDWRNAVLLTSDDADIGGELYFIDNAESIYRQIDETCPVLNVQKVYEDAYKEYSSSSGATYPDASKAINARMKQGCLLFNYLGHGSADHLAGERLITKTDISSWDNYDKLCLMITSTCNFNRFDLVDVQAAGEYILTSDKGAGIALIAAAREISSNDPINRALFRFALERQEDGRPYTFGQVMRHAKNLVNSGYYTFKLTDAERSISLIGDPALRLALPQYDVRTVEMNTDTVRALSTVSIKGEIVDFNGNKIDNFNGQVQISLYDKKKKYYTLNNANLPNANARMEFELQNNILHKGTATVVNGEFSHTFTVPKDIAYNYGNGKLSYYAQNDTTDAAGYYTDFIIGGMDTNYSEFALSRPEIGLYLNDSNFVSGGICDENPSLFAVVYDTVPINTVGSGLGHDIVARLDNAANTYILNDYYMTDADDNNRGYITFPFKNLPEGEHTLTLKVWNIYNYSSEKTISFVVKTSDNEEYEAINYPNPFKDATDIELRYNQPQNIISAYLKIFNQQGAIVREFDISDRIGAYTIGPVHWDGTTTGGSRVQNGLYFYTIILKTQDGDKIVKGNKMILLN